MKKVTVAAAAGLALLVAGLLLTVSAAVSAAVGSTTPGPGGAAAVGVPSSAGSALARVPPDMLALYASAAATCPGLPWAVLAAIGTVESDNGTSDAPGVHSGHNGAGAEGPMQFEPATFAAYDEPVPPGGAEPPSPYDPTDAVYAAARMLCADGAAQPGGLGPAIWDYNHSAAYVAEVLQVAAGYGLGPAPQAGSGPEGSPVGAVALDYALAQVGTPYRWGGEAPGVGFDCSGLTQAAYAAAGVAIPRVAQDQYRAGPPVPPGGLLQPGDLVFFGSGPADVTHVGLVVYPAGVMVDAPHTGAEVRVEAFPPVPGAAWGSDVYLGATAPGA